MNSPRISIIAPNFNHGRFLPAMIDSCLEQSFQDWELIVIDDASTDNSVEIVDEYVRRHRNIRLIRNQVNQGPIRSVNRGFAVASGDYVVMRSADDINLPGYFQTAVALLEEYPQAAFFCGDIAYFREDPTVRQVETLGIGPTPGYYSPEVLIDRLGSTPLHGHTVLIRRELLVEVGYYRESHRWYNDWLPNMAWAFRKGVCYSPIPMMGCRLLSDSFGNKGGSDEALKMATVKTILSDLVHDFPDVVSSFRDSGAVGFFGLAGEKVLAADERLRASLQGSTRAREPDNGITAVIRSVLQEHELALRSLNSQGCRLRIWIFGAGLHTKVLLEQWKPRGLPLPEGIVVSSNPSAAEFCGLPLKSISAADPREVDLVVISSKSYEESMLATVAARFPAAWVMTFWDRTRTRLGPTPSAVWGNASGQSAADRAV